MSIRGQHPDAWRSRFRQGTCPIHGKGFVDDVEVPVDPAFVAVRCPDPECTVRMAQWPGKDPQHAFYGVRVIPDDIRAALVHTGDIDSDPQSNKPGPHARSVRTGWPVPE